MVTDNHRHSVSSLFAGKWKLFYGVRPLFGKNSAQTVVKRLVDICHFKKSNLLHPTEFPSSVLRKNPLYPLKYTICKSPECFTSCTLSRINPLFLNYLYIILDTMTMW